MDDSRIAMLSTLDIDSMSLGVETTCLWTLSGQLKCWGRNTEGQLGRGDTMMIGDDETPDTVDFIELGGLALDVRTNGMRTLALLDGGIVRAWGDNTDHALGLGHTETIGDDETPMGSVVPTDVSLGEPAVEIVLGEDFACARLLSGDVRCWGAHDHGQLGRGNTQRTGDDELPADAPAIRLGTAAVGLTAGLRHACAVLQGGGVRCWGANDHGQLGYGHTAPVGDDEPLLMVDNVSLDGPVERVVAGGEHTCAILKSGSVQCWGAGSHGQLGYGNDKDVGDDELPSSVGSVPLQSLVVELAAGRDHTCAVLGTGALQCWGANDLGQLGRGSTDAVGDDETPAMAGDVELDGQLVLAIFAGPSAHSTCAQLDGPGLRCWGYNGAGQLGYGETDVKGDEESETPGRLPDVVVLDDDDDS